MNLAVLSINYKLAPVEVRERLDPGSGALPAVMNELRERAHLDELLVLSTCNRVEYYFVAEDEAAAVSQLKIWLAERLDGSGGDGERVALFLGGHAALIHLFRVAGSLESMVVGEPQILGQVKEAYRLAVRHKTAGPLLTGLMPRVFQTAKRVRSETEIAHNAVSVSYAAVEMATRIFDSLDDKTVLVIGAGEMAELAIAHLVKHGIRRLLLTNRTLAHAVTLAETFQGEALPYDRLEATLPQADIVISSTGSRDFIIAAPLVRKAMRARKNDPMFFIDIAVPRDIDPAVNSLANVYAYDIDDLIAVTDANRREREAEAQRAQRIIEDEADRYERWFESLSAVPTIKAMRESFHATGERELEKALRQMPELSPRDAQHLRRLFHGMVNKLLHAPSTALKQLAEEGNGKLYAEAVTVLFGLDGAAERRNAGDRAPGGIGEGSEAPDEESSDSDKVVPFPVA